MEDVSESVMLDGAEETELVVEAVPSERLGQSARHARGDESTIFLLARHGYLLRLVAPPDTTHRRD